MWYRIAVLASLLRPSSAIMRHELLEKLRASPAILAPLTRASTPPFRALCVAHGCEATMGEMIFAKYLRKGDRREKARLRRHDSEPLFGAQIATNTIAEGAAACAAAADAGADWVDLNCGCPIYEATRRGLGSALLRSPRKLARLVGGICEASPVPVSVKLRLSPAGPNDANYLEHVAALRDLGEDGPAFLTLHGRTATQRYGKPADWAAIEAAAGAAGGVPLVGNGDVLTHYEAAARRAAAPAAAGLMVGRGALVTPWLFDEIRSGSTWLPTAEERAAVYYELAANYRTQFGDDARGKNAAFYFLPFHFNFLHRWRPLPEAAFGDLAARAPLIQSGRDVDARLRDLEGPDLPPLERLLRCAAGDAHDAIAHALWDGRDAADAVAALERLATEENLAAWAAPTADGEDEDEGHVKKQKAPPKKKKKVKVRVGRKDNSQQTTASLSTRTCTLYRPVPKRTAA